MSVCKGTHLQSILLLSVIGLMFLPIPMGTLWWREVFNTGHTFVFMVFAYLLAKQIFSKNIFSNLFIVYLIALFVLLLLGVVIELAQGFVDREMSWGDLQNDLFGSLAGLAFFHARRLRGAGVRHQTVPSVLLAVLLASSMILFGSFSFMQLSWHYIQRGQAFPVIADFGQGWAKSFVRYNKVRQISPVKNNRGMYVFEFSPGRYPGINLVEPEADWSQYQQLRFKIFSTYKEKIIFALRIHDGKHNQGFADRFNTRLTISPGMNNVVVDVDRIKKGMFKRKLDIEDVAGMTLFIMKLEQRHTFEISKLYLE